MPDPGRTKSSLLSRLRARDDAGYERLVELYGPWIYHRCRSSNLSAQDAEDIVQEVFKAVFQNIERFEHRSFRRWLMRIQVNEVVDHIRRTKGWRGHGGSDHAHQIHDFAARQSLDDVTHYEDEASDDPCMAGPAHRALESLERSGRFDVDAIMAFRLTEVEGWTAAEVAAEQGTTANAVRNAKVRIRRELRKMLRDTA